MINMNIVSWGTREIPKIEDMEKVRSHEKKQRRRKAIKGLKKFFLNICCCIRVCI